VLIKVLSIFQMIFLCSLNSLSLPPFSRSHVMPCRLHLQHAIPHSWRLQHHPLCPSAIFTNSSLPLPFLLRPRRLTLHILPPRGRLSHTSSSQLSFIMNLMLLTLYDVNLTGVAALTMSPSPSPHTRPALACEEPEHRECALPVGHLLFLKCVLLCETPRS
jgi:hypothetical protein